MFKNLQLFDELNEKEVMIALKAVLTKDKALVLLLTRKPLLKLVPVETDVCIEIGISGAPVSFEARWKSRMRAGITRIAHTVEVRVFLKRVEYERTVIRGVEHAVTV